MENDYLDRKLPALIRNITWQGGIDRKQPFNHYKRRMTKLRKEYPKAYNSCKNDIKLILTELSEHMPELRERQTNLTQEQRKAKTKEYQRKYYQKHKSKLQEYNKAKYAEKKGEPVKKVKHTIKYLKKKTCLHL